MAAEHGCQLYLVSPPAITVVEFLPLLEEAFAASTLTGAFLLRLEDTTHLREAALAVQPLCAQYGVALVLHDAVELALELDADGVQVFPRQVAQARNILGTERIIGVECGQSRDTAMKAGEAGADYVWFDSEPELLAWWQEYMLLPCVAAGNLSPQQCHTAVAAGADFLVAGEALWQYPQGAAAAIRAYEAAIIEALPKP